ncbi:MAG: hypothetical protein JHD36_02760, partial [Ilumatobacteraceae bacterium]|nr:hypothetical protein [Ilumatobacteraceae bacterium]
GVAYVYDPDSVFAAKVNYEMVELETLDDIDRSELEGILSTHVAETQSAVGIRILGEWKIESAKFVKVMPRDYKRVLAVMAESQASGLSEQEILDRVMEVARG